MQRIAMGIDIGGSHITCQLYDLEAHSLLEGTRVRVAVDSSGTQESIMGSWMEAIAGAVSGHEMHRLSGIGFAMPGPFDYPNGIALFKGVKKFDSLYGLDVRKAVQNHFVLPPGFPVRFLNDASCFAIGESFQGEAASFDRFLAITLGTGFGATFISNHLPVAGKEGASEDGYLYHVPFEDSIADEHFTTRWFQREYLTRTGKTLNGVKQLTEMAGQDGPASEIFDLFGRKLAIFLSPWLKSFQAGCLVIGGNISQAYRHFRPGFEQELSRNGLNMHMIISGLQEDAALSGSANLCDDSLYLKLLENN